MSHWKSVLWVVGLCGLSVVSAEANQSIRLSINPRNNLSATHQSVMNQAELEGWSCTSRFEALSTNDRGEVVPREFHSFQRSLYDYTSSADFHLLMHYPSEDHFQLTDICSKTTRHIRTSVVCHPVGKVTSCHPVTTVYYVHHEGRYQWNCSGSISEETGEERALSCNPVTRSYKDDYSYNALHAHYEPLFWHQRFTINTKNLGQEYGDNLCIGEHGREHFVVNVDARMGGDSDERNTFEISVDGRTTKRFAVQGDRFQQDVLICPHSSLVHVCVTNVTSENGPNCQMIQLNRRNWSYSEVETGFFEDNGWLTVSVRRH